MVEYAYAIAISLVALLAWDGWRRYLAHRERVTNESLGKMREELTKWQETVRKAVAEVNSAVAVVKRSTMGGLVRGRRQE